MGGLLSFCRRLATRPPPVHAPRTPPRFHIYPSLPVCPNAAINRRNTQFTWSSKVVPNPLSSIIQSFLYIYIFEFLVSLPTFLALLPLLAKTNARRRLHAPSMAVQAHHLPLFPSQVLRNQEIVAGVDRDQSAMKLGDAGPAAGPLLSFCDSPALVNSDSGVFFLSASRKRPREDFSSSHVRQELLNFDRLVVDQVARLRVELAGRLRRILAAAEEGASKRLKAKEEEVELARKVALALEERMKSLCVENQMWREVARSSEAVVCALRADLDRALAEAATATTNAAAADAESCCGGDREEVARRACRCCGEREPTVLLLPCRHLCACTICGPAAAACPVCDCRKNGYVPVNMSD